MVQCGDVCVLKMYHSSGAPQTARLVLTGRAALLPKPFSSRIPVFLLIVYVSVCAGLQQTTQNLGTHRAQDSDQSFTRDRESAAFSSSPVSTALQSDRQTPTTSGYKAGARDLQESLEPHRRLLQVIFPKLYLLLIASTHCHLHQVLGVVKCS